MARKNILTRQKMSAAKYERAQELRHEMTPAERRLWGYLRANRLEGWHFRRQQVIAGFIVDFYCHQAGLVIEVDGPIHANQQAVDAERTRILAEYGLKVLRTSNQAVMNNPQHVLDCIQAELVTDSPFLGRKGVRG